MNRHIFVSWIIANQFRTQDVLKPGFFFVQCLGQQYKQLHHICLQTCYKKKERIIFDITNPCIIIIMIISLSLLLSIRLLSLTAAEEPQSVNARVYTLRHIPLFYLKARADSVCLSFFFLLFLKHRSHSREEIYLCCPKVFWWLKTPHFSVFLHPFGVFGCLLSPPVVSCLFSICLYSSATVPPCGQHCNNNIVSLSFSSVLVLFFPPKSKTNRYSDKGQIYIKKHVHHFLPTQKIKESNPRLDEFFWIIRIIYILTQPTWTNPINSFINWSTFFMF